jgi:crotonobetainyl-CoA:carnitine CoA-transferase CaiB-like acyl-CoA transferase
VIDSIGPLTADEVPPGGPLDGIKVLDLTYYASGPLGAMVLGDFGADVVKVEPPGGEPGRRLGVTFPGGWSTFFLALNRNKRSLCVDYRQPEGLAVLHDMAKTVDVLIENSRPGSWDKYGLSYEQLRSENPKLIYASVSGFGEVGPMRDWAAMDPIAQAVGGLMSVTGSSESGPVKVGAAVGDVTAGRHLAFGVVLALYQRERSGLGQRVTSSLLDAIISLMPMRETEYQFSKELPKRLGTAHGQSVPGQAFETKDGHQVMLTLYTNEHFQRWCALMGREDLTKDPRFQSNRSRKQHMEATVAAVQSVLGQYTQAELDEMIAGEVPYGPILDFDSLWQHPQLAANGMLVSFLDDRIGEVRNVGSPVHVSGGFQVRHAPPRLGGHSREILSEFGYAPHEIDELVASGTVRVGDTTPDNPPTS